MTARWRSPNRSRIVTISAIDCLRSDCVSRVKSRSERYCEMSSISCLTVWLCSLTIVSRFHERTAWPLGTHRYHRFCSGTAISGSSNVDPPSGSRAADISLERDSSMKGDERGARLVTAIVTAHPEHSPQPSCRTPSRKCRHSMYCELITTVHPIRRGSTEAFR